VHRLNDAHLTGDEVLPCFSPPCQSIRDVGDTIVPQKIIARSCEAHPDPAALFLCSPLIDGAPPIHRDIGWSLTDPEQVPRSSKTWRSGRHHLEVYARRHKPLAGGHRGRAQARLVVTAHLVRTVRKTRWRWIDLPRTHWSVFNYIIPEDARRTPGHRASLDLTNPLARISSRSSRSGG